MISGQATSAESGSVLKSKIILIFLAILALITLFYIEKYGFMVINLMCYFLFLSIFVFILIHVLLVRFIIMIFIFPGKNFIFQKIISHENGKIFAKHLYDTLISFRSDINSIKMSSNLEYINVSFIRSNIIFTKELLENYKTNFFHIQSKYKLSQYQDKFYNNITALLNSINESELEENIDKGLARSYDNFELDRHFNRILLNLKNVEENINDFLLNNDWRQNIKNYFNNDIFGSLYYFRVDLSSKFHVEEYTVETDGHIIDLMLIKGRKKNSQAVASAVNNQRINNRKVVIICGPNGVPFEQYARNMRLEDLYFKNNIDVLVWNYRGYGMTKGSPNFNNIKQDAEAVVEFARRHNIYEIVGVHGISMGGLASCHVAGKNLVDFCIADRTFSSLEDIILTFPFGSMLCYIYKLLVFPDSNTVENYLKCKCPKLVLSDPLDTIINDAASLKTGISHKVVNKLCKSNPSGEVLDMMLTKDEKDKLIESLIFVFESMNNNKHQSKCLKRKASPERNSLLLSDSKNIKYTAFKKTENNSEYEMSSIDSDDNNLRSLLNTLLIKFSKFESSGDSLSTLRKIKLTDRKVTFINNFFTNMFTWGCIVTTNFNSISDDILSHKEISKRFRDFDFEVNELLNQRDSQQHINLEIFNNIRSLLEIFKKLDLGFSKIFTEVNPNTLNINLNVINSLSEEPITNFNTSTTLDYNVIDNSNLGHLIPLSCGHNGNYSEMEINFIKFELVKAKIIS